MAERIYVVTQRGSAPRLVSAGNKASAVNFVADDTISAELASQIALVKMVAEGVKVEQAKNGVTE